RGLLVLGVIVTGFIFGALCLTPASAQSADPPTIRLGYGAAAEEQLYLLLAKPDLGKNYGKAYKLEATRFQSSTQRSQAFEAGAIDIASSGAVGVLFAAAEGEIGRASCRERVEM